MYGMQMLRQFIHASFQSMTFSLIKKKKVIGRLEAGCLKMFAFVLYLEAGHVSACQDLARGKKKLLREEIEYHTSITVTNHGGLHDLLHPYLEPSLSLHSIEHPLSIVIEEKPL
jgi:hypothetical protein